MSCLPIYHASETVSYFTFAATIICNSLSIILTAFYSEKIFKTYRTLLIIFSASFLVFSFLEFLIKPFNHSYNYGYIFFSFNKEYLQSADIQAFIMALYIGLFNSVNSFFCVLFVYRYWALIKSKYLVLFEGWNILIWPLYSLICGIITIYILYEWTAPDEFTNNYMRDVLMERYGKEPEETSGYHVIVYQPCQDGELCIRFAGLIFISFTTFLMSMSTIVVAYCAYNMHHQMNEMLKTCSVTNQRLQRQFFKALLLQSTAPLFTFFIPVGFIFGMLFSKMEFDFPTGFVFSSFGIYPALDSIILMTVVQEYRNAFFQFLRIRRRDGRSTNVTSTHQSDMA